MDEFSRPVEDNDTEKGVLKAAAIISLIIGVLLLIYFISKVSLAHSIPEDGKKLNLAHFGAFGDFIAGTVGTLFSLAGFFFLFLTFQDQKENFKRERLESNFFEMIKFHRDNVNELQFTYYEPEINKLSTNRVTAEKRKVFKLIFVQFKQAWEELKHFFDEQELGNIYKSEYLNKLKRNQVLIDRKIDLKQYAQIDIIYLIIFFGLSKEDRMTLSNIFKEKYNENFTNSILDFAILKPKVDSAYWLKWESLNKLSEKINIFDAIIKRRKNKDYTNSWLGENEHPYLHFYADDYEKYYGGHQFRLGHYYRHFYQTVTFIDKEKSLDFNSKYGYIKILRGQFSNYEQIIFFLNSISSIGRTFELENKINPQEAINFNKHLLTKYNLIKNIPNNDIAGEINSLSYYPNIVYETLIEDDKISKRKLIEFKYY
jgi:hypothetical protein